MALKQSELDKGLSREAALYLHDLGWDVVLQEYPTKKPAFKDWPTKKMTRDELLYWTERTAFNVGVLLGEQICVIDKDAASYRTSTRREAYNWERRHGVFDTSPLSTVTSKGIHSFFKLRGVNESRSRIRFRGLPLDILMGPRVVTVSPSWVANTSHRYVIKSGKRVVAPSELPLLPDSVVEQLNAETRAKVELSLTSRESNGKIRDPKSYALRVESHQGNNGSRGLVRCVCVCRDGGMSEQETFEFMTEVWNKTPGLVVPPWPEAEITRAIRRFFNGG